LHTMFDAHNGWSSSQQRKRESNLLAVTTVKTRVLEEPIRDIQVLKEIRACKS
jgi:hypothetical protein